jgi:hypothetical protein
MKPGDKVKLLFGGGHVGVIIDDNLVRVSFSCEGKPTSGVFSVHELQKTTEQPTDLKPIGFHFIRPQLDEPDEDDIDED